MQRRDFVKAVSAGVVACLAPLALATEPTDWTVKFVLRSHDGVSYCMQMTRGLSGLPSRDAAIKYLWQHQSEWRTYGYELVMCEA